MPNLNKYCLMLCELHYPAIHGKTANSDPNIETHYLVYNRFEPITGISYTQIDEYGFDSDLEIDGFRRINDAINYLKEFYSNPDYTSPIYFGIHPTIRNYHNIVLKPNYIKPEIGEYIILPTQEAIAILKTFWLRIIQKKWKKVFQERKNIISQRCNLTNLSTRETRGRWPQSCSNLPGLKGMLYKLKANNYL
jgi:hypothetical protein